MSDEKSQSLFLMGAEREMGDGGGGGEGRKKARFFLEANCVLSSFAVRPKIFQKSPSPLSQRHLKDQVTPFPLALWAENTVGCLLQPPTSPPSGLTQSYAVRENK